MSELKDKLFWEKYRPKSMKQMILLPRIQSFLEGGIATNLIFYGKSGTGKTSLANILSSEHNFIKINASKDNGIDTLRGKITQHVDYLNFDKPGGTKVVYLDEFDRTSDLFQDGLKGFIEAYDETTRFLFTTNHINKINTELKSRFNEVCFDPLDSKEREFLYEKQIMYLRAISKQENFEMYKDKEPFIKIVNKHFPDLRKSINILQQIIISKDMSFVDKDLFTDRSELYAFIMKGDMDPILNFDYVMDKFQTNFDDVYRDLGRPFFEYLRESNIELLMKKGGLILKTQEYYNTNLPITIDPLIHLINFILELKRNINS